MGAVEIYANQPFTTVSSGGTDAPSSGTVQSWTVASSSEFPAASSTATPPTQFHIVDTASGMTTEIMAVTNVSGTTWTVTRGAESTTPITHASGFQVTQTVTQGALEQARAVDWLNVATMFGADPTGAADSTTAIQDAISAAAATGGAVYLPTGTYLVSSALTVGGAMRLTGGAPGSATIKTTASGVFDFGGTYITGLEFDHFAVDCTGGDIFTGLNLHRCYFHHLTLTQRSGGYHIATFGSAGTGLSAATFEDIEQYVYPDPTSGVRSVPAWYLYDGTGSGKNIDVVTFSRIRTINEANASGAIDNTQYIFDIACTVAGSGGLADRVSFRECDGGATLGGLIRCRSVQGLVIDRAGVGNIYNQGTPSVSIGNSMIYIGQYTGAAASESPLVTGYVRENSGTETFGSNYDIYIDAATANPKIDSPVGTGANTNPAISVSLNSAPGAIIDNAPSNVSVTGTASDTIIRGNGTITIGGTAVAKSVAAAANFAPAAPSGTASTTRVMMGLGATCVYTPSSSGKVLVMITASPYVLTSAVYGLISALYGTGTAPANGAAETGTAMPGLPGYTRPPSNAATVPSTFVSSAVLTLTPGTAYWFDISLATSNASDQFNLENVVMSFAELP